MEKNMSDEIMKKENIKKKSDIFIEQGDDILNKETTTL